jgi:hypothetical protein
MPQTNSGCDYFSDNRPSAPLFITDLAKQGAAKHNFSRSYHVRKPLGGLTSVSFSCSHRIIIFATPWLNKNGSAVKHAFTTTYDAITLRNCKAVRDADSVPG